MTGPEWSAIAARPGARQEWRERWALPADAGVIGMIGAFSAGGVVVGLGPSYIKNTLEGGSAGWGMELYDYMKIIREKKLAEQKENFAGERYMGANNAA